MFQFIETICYEHGDYQRIDLHNDRFNRTRCQFWGNLPHLNLNSVLKVPQHLKNEIVKCKITYGKEIIALEYESYQIRPINSLQLVKDDTIEYAFKYADRRKLNSLFELRGQCDDILIIKDGFITDSSYANVVFRKNESWYSPQNPLLKGIRLEGYLLEGRVTPTLLQTKDLHLYSEVRIINAMISIEKAPVIPIKNIKNLIWNDSK